MKTRCPCVLCSRKALLERLKYNTRTASFHWEHEFTSRLNITCNEYSIIPDTNYLNGLCLKYCTSLKRSVRNALLTFSVPASDVGNWSRNQLSSFICSRTVSELFAELLGHYKLLAWGRITTLKKNGGFDQWIGVKVSPRWKRIHLSLLANSSGRGVA